METVLIVGATGNIGVSAVLGARKAGKNVLAVVRNADSAAKLFKHVGSKEGITTVEADVLKPEGVESVVKQVREGKLPAFQHVYATVGGGDVFHTPLHAQGIEYMQRAMGSLYEANFFAYRATIPYLLEQAPADTSFTMCVGGAGDFGMGGAAAVSQGALRGMINAAMNDLKDSNVRVVEDLLNTRVDYDEVAAKKGSILASAYGAVYEKILTDTSIRGARVTVDKEADTKELRLFKQPFGSSK